MTAEPVKPGFTTSAWSMGSDALFWLKLTGVARRALTQIYDGADEVPQEVQKALSALKIPAVIGLINFKPGAVEGDLMGSASAAMDGYYLTALMQLTRAYGSVVSFAKNTIVFASGIGEFAGNAPVSLKGWTPELVSSAACINFLHKLYAVITARSILKRLDKDYLNELKRNDEHEDALLAMSVGRNLVANLNEMSLEEVRAAIQHEYSNHLVGLLSATVGLALMIVSRKWPNRTELIRALSVAMIALSLGSIAVRHRLLP